MSEDIRQLARTVLVGPITPIPGAEAIEAAKVDGWTVVVKKGEFEPGDVAFYFEIDSMLPLDNPAFEFLRPRGFKTYEGRDYHRLKTAKLRGVISQGLLIPERVFDEQNPFLILNSDIAGWLGIIKYDDIEPTATQNGAAVGRWPSHLGRKTDSERVQNLVQSWNTIVDSGPWFATEKIDGSSLSVFRENGELIICSRNWQVDSGIHAEAVKQNQALFDCLPEGWGIQAEVYGEGVQGNRLGVSGKRVAVFAVLNHGEVVSRDNWFYQATINAVPVYASLNLPDTIEAAVDQADGIKSLVSPDRLAEGIVWQQANGESLMEIGDRPNFKVISNKYLLKEK